MTWYTTLAFIRNQWSGKRWDAFHSPYLFKLFSFMRNDQVGLGKFKDIERLRQSWLNNKSSITRTDFGMGSVHSGKPKEEPICKIANRALSLPFQCRALARLVMHEQPGFILEFGTSLGISTAYLQSGNMDSKVVTVEGDPAIAQLAKITFEKLDLKNITLINKSFDYFFENENEIPGHIDLLFLDGHHQSTALLRYYSILKNRFSPKTIVIVDDIYWSKDMEEGWEKLKDIPEVTQSVDCFQFGILFFRNEFLEKEHHCIRLPLKALIRN